MNDKKSIQIPEEAARTIVPQLAESAKEKTASAIAERLSFAFRLEDGTTVIISRKDITDLATHLAEEMMPLLSLSCKFGLQLDKPEENQSKAEFLKNMLDSEKDLSPEVRNSYHMQILKLIGG